MKLLLAYKDSIYVLIYPRNNALQALANIPDWIASPLLSTFCNDLIFLA